MVVEIFMIDESFDLSTRIWDDPSVKNFFSWILVMAVVVWVSCMVLDHLREGMTTLRKGLRLESESGY